MILWGGFNAGNYLNTGERYNAGTDSWTVTSTTHAPVGREFPTAIWTGSEMITWGGFLNTGGRYTRGFGAGGDLNTGGRYCAVPPGPTPTATPTATATPRPTVTPRAAPTPRARPTPHPVPNKAYHAGAARQDAAVWYWENVDSRTH